jgi:hypothetical protein
MKRDAHVLRVDLDTENEFVIRHFLLDSLDYLEYDSGTVLETSTIFVRSLVYPRRSELT